MMTTKWHFGCALALLASCTTSQLERLVVDGKDLHSSLTTAKLNDLATLQVPTAALKRNPILSTDAKFVEEIARGSSQGRLDGKSIRAALYARYLGDKSDLGIYGLEAATTADADGREASVRKIWAHNERLGRAMVHREGKVIAVVWHDGLSPAIWEKVNKRIAKRMKAR